MHLVLAVIQPTKLRAVQDALVRVGVERMTVCDALGYGEPPGQRTGSGPPALQRTVALEIAVNEDFVDKTVETIVRVARTGQTGAGLGDGRVFVMPIEEVVRLSDTVRGPEAIS